ncbi:MAG: DUF4255 domain-containing protein [Bacteroidota bacterium]
MIQNVLPVVAKELNDYLKSRFNSLEDKVVMSNIMDQSGSLAIEGNNKVVFSLINITEETTLKAGSSEQMMGGSYAQFSPSVHVNLTVLLSTQFNPKNYTEALRYVSGVIYFFQSKPLFTYENTPGLDPNINKLHFDLQSMSTHDLMSLFSLMGAKYTPSVIYRVKMLTFNQETIVDTLPAISETDVEGGG